MLDKFRVFLSYRGVSSGDVAGLKFEKELYRVLTDDPAHEERYGKIYFSPEELPFENFKEVIPKIMPDVEYFIMPLTENYFNGFWDSENNCPNTDSITYVEVKAAIENNCKFICVTFPGFADDIELYKKLFGKDYGKISTLKKDLEYSEATKQDVMSLIAFHITRPDYIQKGAYDLLEGLEPNVFLCSKEQTESSSKYPLYQRFQGVTKLTLMNFAASSFISSVKIASVYKGNDYLKNWFVYNLINGNIEVDMILTNPYSYAANDAAEFKMYPSGKNDAVAKDEIILNNLNTLYNFMQNYPSANLKVYLTDIALPYAVAIADNINSDNDHMKVDLYSPLINDDKNRPSFYLLRNNPDTERLYNFFRNNLDSVLHSRFHTRRFNGHPYASWLTDKNKHIIHRARINNQLLAHTYESYLECIDSKYPIEVDLLKLKDGSIIVGRADQDIKRYGYDKSLEECDITELLAINKNAGNNKILTFNKFLDLIAGKIPVLIEIKVKSTDSYEYKEEYVSQIIKSIQKYLRTYSYSFNKSYNNAGSAVAVHSSNPDVLKIIKSIDCMIPCGIISTDFSGIKDIVGEEFYNIHKNATYLDDVNIDFISYDWKFLKNGQALKIKSKKNIPLLAWTIKDQDSQSIAEEYNCDNIIIEESKNYF